MKLLKYENAKLHNQLVFNLPVSMETCARICPGCYALKPQQRFPAVLAYRNERLHASKQSDFITRITTEIQACRKPLAAVRIHESGEFYSQDYISSWTTIVSSLPTVRFYAFTKRLADFDFTQLQALPNFVLINSLHTGGLNYAKAADLPTSVFTCPATTSPAQCGIDCSWCWTKCAQYLGVQFVKH